MNKNKLLFLLFIWNTYMIQAHSGLLFVFEGIDGSGKTLITKNLTEKIKQLITVNVINTKEPDATSLGIYLRSLFADCTVPTCLKSEFLLFAADRAQHFETIIVPKLQDGWFIISDRMADSCLTYQGYLKGLDLEMINLVNNWCMQSIQPDLVFYLKIDPATAIKRIQDERKFSTKFEDELINKFQQLIDGFETIFSTRNNVITLDATQDPEIILNQAFDHIQKHWSKKHAY